MRRLLPTADDGADDEVAVDATSVGYDGPGTETAPEPDGEGRRGPTSRWVRLRQLAEAPWVTMAALAGTVALGVVVRFLTTSDLWLDEALSVNIASLEPGDLLEALRHDGHPPLYYVLLHYWMEVVGDGDVAVRALSGVFAVAALPLAWVAGRRLGGGRSSARWALALVAVSPYWIRYGSEARMYSLVMLLVLAGYLILVDALQRPSGWRLAALAGLSGLLLLSHYWSFYLLAAVGLVLALRWWRRPDVRRATGLVTASLAAGGLLFLPWLPSFLYQAERTGTPWAGPVRPLSLVRGTLQDLGGGALLDEAFAYGAGLVVLCLVALFTVKATGNQVVLDLRTRPGVRRELGVVLATAGIGCAVGYLTGATYQSRYAAVFVPLLLLATAVGIARLPGVARAVAGGAMVVLSVVGVGWNFYYQRTQAGDVGTVLAGHAQPGDVVLYCPDQLGPGFSRAMPDGLVEVTYPDLDDPTLVDWVDYEERNAAAEPEAIAAEVRQLAGSGNIFVVWNGGYETFGQQCEETVHLLGQERTLTNLVPASSDRFYEPATLTWITP